MSFAHLGLTEPLRQALQKEGYIEPTPIQQQAIPPALQGRDVLGCAQTGTGKTAAFALPLLQRLSAEKPVQRGAIRALVLTPTRELALQVSESMAAYGTFTRLRSAVIYGGVSQKEQTRRLQAGVDILIATPGRLLDLMEQGYVRLQSIEILVLDEADRMLDMGFIRDIRKIIATLPQKKQTLFFSATMPAEIRSLAHSLLHNPVQVAVSSGTEAVGMIEQSVYFVRKENKRRLLQHILDDKTVVNALVFTRTKHGADKVCRELGRSGIRAEAIHGNKSQNNRQSALKNFRSGKTRVLVATDIAARGLDIEELSHVINFELPNIPETYLHRIGRTGRAGAGGIAIAFCDDSEKPFLRDIRKMTGRDIPVRTDHPPFAEEVSLTMQKEPLAERRDIIPNRIPNRRGAGKRRARRRA